MGLIKEFKEFAVKGNMMDMAIGIIIGASFNKVVDILVKKILLPPLSLLSNGISLADKSIVLRNEVIDANGKILINESSIGYGAFA